jgi:hypothetical protein
MATNIKRNPASRLHQILKAAWGSSREMPARHVWCGVFGISDPDSETALFEVQSRLLALRKLFSDTQSSLASIPNVNKELYIEPVRRLSNIIDFNRLHHSFSTIVTGIDPNDLIALVYASDLIRQNQDAQENEISSDEIQEIVVELNDLYERVLVSALPPNLKEALLDLLQQMLRDIHEYRVRGAAALRDLLARSIAFAVANKDELDANKDAAEIQALVHTLGKIDKAYTFAMRMQPLLQSAANIFPLLAAHIK